MSRVFGIDLGTTYSCVCYIDDRGMPQIVEDIQNADRLIPSVVLFEENAFDDEVVIVGTQAKEQVMLSPERAISAVKRHMHREGVSFPIDGRNYSPVDISAKILAHLKKVTEEKLGEPMTDVVITVPAYFGALERDRTRQAGVDAGLIVHDILPEPMAAALHYGIDVEEEGRTILVYDLGGGTFDVTIMNIEAGGHKRALATTGDESLGGVDWDKAIARHWAQKIAAETGQSDTEITENVASMAALMFQAEILKKRLNNAPSAKGAITLDGVPRQIAIDRGEFVNLTSDLLERTITEVENAIEVARKDRPDLKIDKVILVGGSTLMGQVKPRLQAFFGDDVELVLNNPHFAVAYGAALYAAQVDTKEQLRKFVQLNAQRYGLNPKDFAAGAKPVLTELPDEVLKGFSDEKGEDVSSVVSILRQTFTDVCPKSFGIKHQVDGREGDFTTNLIRAQQEMPAKGVNSFATVAADQRIVKLICVQNARDTGIDDDPYPFDEAEVVGTAELKLDPGLPKGAPIEVTIEFTPTGLVLVHGRDLTNGREVKGEFRGSQ